MADTKGSALTQSTTFTSDDFVLFVDERSGVPVLKIISRDNLLKGLIDSVAQGDIIIRNATTWARLAAGTAQAVGLGYFLRTGGAGANPAYGAINSQIVLFNKGAGQASATSGATSPSRTEMSTNKQNLYGWQFPDGSTTYVELIHPLPADYDGGTITAQFFWTANSTSTNSVVWGLQGVAMADNDAIDVAW